MASVLPAPPMEQPLALTQSPVPFYDDIGSFAPCHTRRTHMPGVVPDTPPAATAFWPMAEGSIRHLPFLSSEDLSPATHQTNPKKLQNDSRLDWNLLNGIGNTTLEQIRSRNRPELHAPSRVKLSHHWESSTSLSSPKPISSSMDGERRKTDRSQITETGNEIDEILEASLVKFHLSCGKIQESLVLFDKLQKYAGPWSAMIETYCQYGFYEEALQLLEVMQQTNLRPRWKSVISVLKTCMNNISLEQGKYIHLYITENSLDMDTYVGNLLIQMYIKCGCIEHAKAVFDGLFCRDLITWNVMIGGYSQQCDGQEALCLFYQMLQHGFQPNAITFISILRACTFTGTLEQCNQIHYLIVDTGLEIVLPVCTALIDMYAKLGKLEDAQALFDRAPKQDLVMWNVLLSGYTQHGQSERALEVLQFFQREDIIPDRIFCACMVKACCESASLELGRQIHAYTIDLGFECSSTVGSAVIELYAQCSDLDDLCLMFNRLQSEDPVIWSVFMAKLIDRGHGFNALKVFETMQQRNVKADKVAIVCILKACSNVAALCYGKLIHSYAIKYGMESDLSIRSALIDMYTKSGSLKDAEIVFCKFQMQDIVTWSVMIASYVQHEFFEDALELFEHMKLDGRGPNAITFVSIIKACTCLSVLHDGKGIHHQIALLGFEQELFVANSLIDMYAKCGYIQEARYIFESLHEKDVVTWNAIIAGCVKNECGLDAVRSFRRMSQNGIEPDKVTYIAILKACASIAALKFGKEVHSKIIDAGIESDAFIGSALIDMYNKCGSLDDACFAFQRWSKRDVVTWSTMIGTFVHHSDYERAFHHFEEMQRIGVQPNDVTFLSLLTACSRLGLVDKACLQFKSMIEVHGIEPLPEHFNTMIDLFGKARHWDAAVDFLETVPIRSNILGWTTLLGACGACNNIELAIKSFNNIKKMDSGHAASHVMMKNIYNHAGMHENAEEIENLRKMENAWKKPARAYIEIDEKVHVFTVGDTSHPDTEQIHEKLRKLNMQMNTSSDLQDRHKTLDDCGHSERLAVALGLISTPPGTTIRVTKNLRMCSHCHAATKTISEIELREIVITDLYCSHHFKDGFCSCEEVGIHL